MKIPKYKLFYAIVDFIIVYITLIISILMLDFYSNNKLLFNVSNNITLLSFSFIVSLIFIFIFQSNGLYKINIILSVSNQLTLLLKSIFYGSIVIIITAYITKISLILNSRILILSFLILSFLILSIVRLLLLTPVYKKLSLKRILFRRAIIIGAGRAGKMLAAKLLLGEIFGLKLIGFLDDNVKKTEMVISNLNVLGKVDDITQIIKKERIDEILIAIDNITYSRLLEILDVCINQKVKVTLSSELFEIVNKKIITEKYSDVPIINVSPQFNNRLYFNFKRIIDIIGSLLGLIIFLPLFLILALIIKISSEGPVFYIDERIGKNGKPFKFYKFRSMKIAKDGDKLRKEMMVNFIKTNGTNNSNGDTKIINEKRVTWIGKIIRKSSIDELPQLFNVLKGDMSLVGPRPCLKYELENFSEWQKKRLSVLPGCTGIWQVSGRCEVSFSDSVVLDLYYINNMSPWLDIQLILKTIPIMLFGRGGK